MSYHLGNHHRAYQLKNFQHILDEIEANYELFPDLSNKVILELGPGKNIQLLRYLRDLANPKSIQGIGKTKLSFWNKKNTGVDQKLILDSLILPAMKMQKSSSVDLIYSRHVLEQHSMEAAILYKHPAYMHAIKNDQFGDLPDDFPSSIKNVQSIFMECYRTLKPGGVMISQVAKKSFRVLIPAGLEAFKPKSLKFSDIGQLSEISTFVK